MKKSTKCKCGHVKSSHFKWSGICKHGFSCLKFRPRKPRKVKR